MLAFFCCCIRSYVVLWICSRIHFFRVPFWAVFTFALPPYVSILLPPFLGSGAVNPYAFHQERRGCQPRQPEFEPPIALKPFILNSKLLSRCVAEPNKTGSSCFFCVPRSIWFWEFCFAYQNDPMFDDNEIHFHLRLGRLCVCVCLIENTSFRHDWLNACIFLWKGALKGLVRGCFSASVEGI